MTPESGNHTRIKSEGRLFGRASCSTPWNRSLSSVLIGSIKTHRDRYAAWPRRHSRYRGLIVAGLALSHAAMAILHHYPFCPHSRFARLALAETGIEPELREERP